MKWNRHIWEPPGSRGYEWGCWKRWEFRGGVGWALFCTWRFEMPDMVHQNGDAERAGGCVLCVRSWELEMGTIRVPGKPMSHKLPLLCLQLISPKMYVCFVLLPNMTVFDLTQKYTPGLIVEESRCCRKLCSVPPMAYHTCPQGLYLTLRSWKSS